MATLPRIALAVRLRRFFAVGSAALVLALAVFTASPGAHAWLHAAGDDCSGHAQPSSGNPIDDDAGCAVVLFAGGVSLPVGPAAIAPPTLAPQGASPVTAAKFRWVSPRYLRQPERGPPLSWVS